MVWCIKSYKELPTISPNKKKNSNYLLKQISNLLKKISNYLLKVYNISDNVYANNW